MRILTAMVRDGPQRDRGKSVVGPPWQTPWRGRGGSSVAGPPWRVRGGSVAGPSESDDLLYLQSHPLPVSLNHHATPPLNMYIEFGSCLQTLHRISELISFADNRSIPPSMQC